jgi:hypothetical protein
MQRIIKRIKVNHKVIFDWGIFDDFCVYVVDKYNMRRAPKDVEYFEFFRDLAKSMGNEKVYDDFLMIYKMTSKEIKQEVRDKIEEIAKTYPENVCFEVEKNFTVIWGGMIAEENKENTRLGKRIKHLGMYQVLIEGMDVKEAANFSKNQTAENLNSIMKEKGI